VIEPLRAEHVGSLLRPPELLAARTAHERGEIDREALRMIEDQAILAVLKLQRDIGLGIVTDGEYRRASWLSGFTDAVEGFVAAAGTREWKGDGGKTVAGGSHRSRAIATRLRKTGRIAAHEASFLTRHAEVPFKITLPSPIVYLTSGYKPGITDKVYPTRKELATDLVAILREEILALVAEGVPYIQIDAPQYTQLADPSLRDWVRQSGWDPDRAIDEAIAADKACIAGIRRPGRTIAVHLCRGNYRGLWRAEGGYDPLAERLFNAFDVDRFLLEYDSERAGTFEPLRFVPKGKIVVLGLVTTKGPQLESQDELLRRIEEAARHMPIEYLALSPQCGFATQAGGNPLSFDDQRRKLELIVDTAHKVWH
jgi:5-methyltetrahydropteroyltriglutamate--homocysteine methyltransferase